MPAEARALMKNLGSQTLRAVSERKSMGGCLDGQGATSHGPPPLRLQISGLIGGRWCAMSRAASRRGKATTTRSGRGRQVSASPVWCQT